MPSNHAFSPSQKTRTRRPTVGAPSFAPIPPPVVVGEGSCTGVDRLAHPERSLRPIPSARAGLARLNTSSSPSNSSTGEHSVGIPSDESIASVRRSKACTLEDTPAILPEPSDSPLPVPRFK